MRNPLDFRAHTRPLHLFAAFVFQGEKMSGKGWAKRRLKKTRQQQQKQKRQFESIRVCVSPPPSLAVADAL
jgi:hypothetical protein